MLKEIDTRMELVSNKLHTLQEELEKEIPDAKAKKRFDEYVEMQQEMMIEKNTLMLNKELYELTQMHIKLETQIREIQVKVQKNDEEEQRLIQLSEKLARIVNQKAQI